MPTFDEMVGAAFDKATAPPMKGEKKPKVEVEVETEADGSLSAAEQKILDAVKSGSDALKAAVKAAC